MSGGGAPWRHDQELPPAFSSMWRLCKLGFRLEPSLMGVAFVLALAAAAPDALLAFWFKVLPSHPLVATIGLGVTAVAGWFLGTVSARVQRRFRDRVTIGLEAHVARLQASVSTIAHQERPEYLDRLSVLRNQVFVLDHMYMSVFSTAGWVLRLALSLGLLAAIHPALLLLAVFAVPTVVTASWRPPIERRAFERGDAHQRLARHLFTLATTASPGKEVRLTGIGDRIATRRREEWEQWYGPIARTRTGSAVWHTLGWTVFGLGYIGAVVFVASGLDAPAGDVLLVLAVGSRLSAYIGATVGEIGFLRGIWMDGSRRLAWLEDYAAAVAEHAGAAVPERLHDGIRVEHLSFVYPGTDRFVLDDVDLTLPSGSVVAVVGENGAGKTTLVKLLSKLYAPTSGRILVDGVDLAGMPAEEWRGRVAGAYQDFFRFELLARQSIGLGDVPRLDDEPAVSGAVDRAGATDVVGKLPSGLATQLGPTWPGGVEVSFGQWQKLALARGFMREEPLLLVLDEPTAALDAETEHELFERYAAGARRGSGVTILVSHRFSTVRMADLIVVLDGAKVAEVGTHEDLMRAGGQYASLYEIQSAAYR